ncbi:hypothetical protein VTN31DRAFT_5973 [Thermomyces dupontii]|uniref:uncharacterized protein n=1 Tax=Talaromyces thermophilus TaxID=28565 RepID=UPI00374292F6
MLMLVGRQDRLSESYTLGGGRNARCLLPRHLNLHQPFLFFPIAAYSKPDFRSFIQLANGPTAKVENERRTWQLVELLFNDDVEDDISAGVPAALRKKLLHRIKKDRLSRLLEGIVRLWWFRKFKHWRLWIDRFRFQHWRWFLSELSPTPRLADCPAPPKSKPQAEREGPPLAGVPLPTPTGKNST